MDTIEQTEGGTVYSGRQAVEVYRLGVLISALRLHKMGIRAFRAMSALQAARITTGLKTRSADLHIARLELMRANAVAQVIVNKEPQS